MKGKDKQRNRNRERSRNKEPQPFHPADLSRVEFHRHALALVPQVFKLVTEGTLEEKIAAIIEKRRRTLSSALFDLSNQPLENGQMKRPEKVPVDFPEDPSGIEIGSDRQ